MKNIENCKNPSKYGKSSFKTNIKQTVKKNSCQKSEPNFLNSQGAGRMFRSTVMNFKQAALHSTASTELPRGGATTLSSSGPSCSLKNSVAKPPTHGFYQTNQEIRNDQEDVKY